MLANASAIIEWLTSDECHGLDLAGLVAHLGRMLRAAGFTLERLGLFLRTLHPETLGRAVLWSLDGPVEIHHRPHGFDLVDHSTRARMRQGEWITVRLDDPPFAAGPLHDLFSEPGLTELVLVPLLSGQEEIGGTAFATRCSEGFTTGEVAMLRRIVPALRTSCEVRALRRTEANLLDTYVGPVASRRILAGHIRRGDVETIYAALMLCDMRGFTALSDRLPETRVLEFLNLYFDQIVPPIVDAGGEILKFMGDAVLAFFRSESDPVANCSAAFDAAVKALARLDAIESPDAELRAGIALHHGTASYGNIGSAPRLDFTVIGRDVNLVSRIESVCAATGQRLLMSARFAQLLARTDVQPIGPYALKGFDRPPELFAWTGGKATFY